jgi:DNA polymerase-4
MTGKINESGKNQRLIMHVDMNSYFASVEQQANPFLRGKSIAVSGHPKIRTVIASASIEAKQYGIKSGMNLSQAKKLCPSIIFIPGDPAKYLATTTQILNILKSYSPILEVFSIDEAFLDLTDLLQNYRDATSLGTEIKYRLKTEVGDWLKCSIGLAPNKLLAKLASDLIKPDGLTVIEPRDIPKILAKIELDDLCGIGPRLAEHLRKMGIRTVQELGQTPESILVKHFGQVWGKWLKKSSQGIDETEVVPYCQMPPPKSMGHSYTLPANSTNWDQIYRVLLRLAEKVGRRLRKEKMAGRVVTVVVRFFNFSSFHQQKALPYHINDGILIFRVGRQIIEQNLNLKYPVRLVGISVGDLISRQQQLPLFNSDQKARGVLQAMDKINDQYGEFTLSRATLFEKNNIVYDISGIGRTKRLPI